jgi:hypothetical protein
MSSLVAETTQPIVQLTKHGTVFCGSSESLEQLRSQFEGQHYFRLSQLIEPALLHLIQRQIDGGEFYEKVHERIDSNKELCLVENAASGALLFLANDEKLFELIQQITRCARVRCFDGRIYRANPDNGHHDSWHNDIGEDRLVGMTVNLSREEYAGGILQLRDRESRATISEIPNVRAGDAVVFRLASSLQHRITEVKGNTSKTAFAGWFRAQPDFSRLLKRNYADRGSLRLSC